MNDIIVAVSTALGVGAISIIRVSGEGAIKLVSNIFDGKNLNKVNTHTIHYGHIVETNEIIDEVLVSVMKAPKTYTQDDTVEINCHGGIATTNKVLEIILRKGARLAEPGEFTKRAFLNGRIDLVKAEAVIDLINSKTEKARSSAVSNLSGRLTNVIRIFRQDLLELIANIEVNVDYPEYDDIEVITNNTIKDKITSMRKSLNQIVIESENGKMIKTGIKVVIVGRPNVGKSSILNKLLEEDKAIVTDVAGTTRDVVEGSITLDGILLNFVDTAGIRETNDIVEKFGVEKSLNELKTADLVIMVLNNNEEVKEEDIELLNKIKDIKTIIVINKKDLPSKIDLCRINANNIIYTNTIDTDGIDVLKEKIIELFKLNEIEQKDFNIFGNVRQITLAKEALDILSDVEEALKESIPVDLIEIDIKKIWDKLGEIIGETYSEELINQLFSQFCLGK